MQDDGRYDEAADDEEYVNADDPKGWQASVAVSSELLERMSLRDLRDGYGP